MEIIYEIGYLHGKICYCLWWDNDGDDVCQMGLQLDMSITMKESDVCHIQTVLSLSLVREGKDLTLELIDVEPDALGTEVQLLGLQVHFRMLSLDILCIPAFPVAQVTVILW